MKSAIRAVVLLSGAAWGFAPAVQAQGAPPPPPAKTVTVRIVAPHNGDTLSGPVTIKLEATGVEIVPATIERPGTGHHHLFVDHDMTWLNDTIPAGSPGIHHLGRGQKEFVLDSLAPGPHRVIALIADWRHVPLNPLVADTVTFVIR